MPGPIEVFFCYSHKDDALCSELKKHLAGLKREGVIADWNQRRVDAGDDWKTKRNEHLDSAGLILLLVSADFLAADYCYDVEVTRALERRYAGEVEVIPIILRACDWSGAPFADLDAMPHGAKPVTSWADRDDAWGDVVSGIRAVVSDARARAASRAPTPSYPDPETRAISGRIEAAQKRRRSLQQGGFDTKEVDLEILGLRRQLRQGGQLRPGDALDDGRYLIIDRLGQGGFAVVWKAHDRQRDRLVAIKVLRGELVRDEIRLERFLRGARRMAEIDHPAVVRVLDPSGEDGGFRYFVMELVAGGDFRAAVLEGRVPREKVVPLILTVGDALVEAHRRGLVHRDVKPANILLDESGAPKLTDFDLVGGADTTGGTRTGALGTFLYAAPEMMDRPQDADVRADVYSLGMTAIFGLYGAELPMTVLREIDRILAGLPCSPAVQRVLWQAVAWDPGLRYRSCAALCEVLKWAYHREDRTVTPGHVDASPRPATSPVRFAPSRPASIFVTTLPQEGASIFGEDLISEKALDEVILSYLSEDLDDPGTPKK
jgi:serine/threonine protein kinase